MTKDAKLLCNWWNDGMIMSHAGYPNGLDTTEHEVLNSLKLDNDLNQRLILECSNVPIGEMNYRTIEAGVAKIGIKICQFDQRNRGFGSIYLKLLIDTLFTEMGYTKIILDTNVKNTHAQHVYEKLGFQQVAVRHSSSKNQLGQSQSFIDYELVRDAYQANK